MSNPTTNHLTTAKQSALLKSADTILATGQQQPATIKSTLFQCAILHIEQGEGAWPYHVTKEELTHCLSQCWDLTSALEA